MTLKRLFLFSLLIPALFFAVRYLSSTQKIMASTPTPPPNSISGNLWIDTNNDGKQDGESLYSCSETQIKPQLALYKIGNPSTPLKTITVENGEYLFSNLTASKYHLKISQLPVCTGVQYQPTKWRIKTAPSAGNLTDVSEYNSTNGTLADATDTWTTTPFWSLQVFSEQETYVYLGIKPVEPTPSPSSLPTPTPTPTPPPNSISGNLWIDINGDGQQDGENIYSCSGIQTKPQLSLYKMGNPNSPLKTIDVSNGNFSFTSLGASKYHLKISQLPVCNGVQYQPTKWQIKTAPSAGNLTDVSKYSSTNGTLADATDTWTTTPFWSLQVFNGEKTYVYLGIKPVESTPLPNYWRGAGAPKQSGGTEMLTNLNNVSWFFNWSPSGPWEDSRYVPLVFSEHGDSQEELEQLKNQASQYPGRTWLVFNEPDLAEQDNLSPSQGAQFYEQLYDAIKGADSAAKLFCCGTAFSNTVWLEEFRQNLTRTVDGIHFHGYPCSRSNSQECVGAPNYYSFNERFNMILMKQKLNSFYNYLQTKKEFANKPIWLTEIGILSIAAYDNQTTVRNQVMNPLLNYLQNEGGWQKFARVAWFSTRYTAFDASDLTKSDNSLTVLGERWNTSSNPY